MNLLPYKNEKDKKLNKQIYALAIPNILTNLSVPLLSSVDTAVVGHLKEVYYLGAIAIGSMIFNFIYWGFGFLRMGTTGLTAQSFGEKNEYETSAIAMRALTLAIAGGLLLIALAIPIHDIAFKLIHASEDVVKYASSYYYIRIYAAPATLAIYVFHGWFLGMQNAKYPMVLLISVNILNIILDLLFVFQFGMKSDGVALGTVFAQYFGLGLALFLFLKKYPEYLKRMKFKMLTDVERLKNFFKVHSDIFLRTLALIFTLSFFTAESAVYGDNILAANTILMQLWVILSYAIDGFAFAGESLVGKYKGKQDTATLRRVVFYLFYWGFVFAAIFTFAYTFFGNEILSLFTNNKTVIALGLSYLYWTSFTPVLNSVSFIWDGIYIGATATSTMRNTMLIATLVFYLPVYYLLKPALGNNALWLALVMFMVARAVSLTLYANRDIFTVKKN